MRIVPNHYEPTDISMSSIFIGLIKLLVCSVLLFFLVMLGVGVLMATGMGLMDDPSGPRISVIAGVLLIWVVYLGVSGFVLYQTGQVVLKMCGWQKRKNGGA